MKEYIDYRIPDNYIHERTGRFLDVSVHERACYATINFVYACVSSLTFICFIFPMFQMYQLFQVFQMYLMYLMPQGPAGRFCDRITGLTKDQIQSGQIKYSQGRSNIVRED